MDPSPESITYNGKSYASWDDLPKEARDLIRSQLPDTDDDGVPDIFQGGPVPEPTVTTSVTTSYSVNGHAYDSLDDVPDEERAYFEQPQPGRTSQETVIERTRTETAPVASARHQTLLNAQTLEQPRTPWWRRLFGRG